MKKLFVILGLFIFTGMAACAYTQQEAITILNGKGLKPDSEAMLFNSVVNGNIELTQLFIDAKQIDLNKRYMGIPYLVQALYNKNNQIALLLLENGADPRIKTVDGGSALFYAVKNGQADVVAKILETPGIDIKRQRMFFWIPLKTTAKRKYPEIYEMLVKYEEQEAARQNQN